MAQALLPSLCLSNHRKRISKGGTVPLFGYLFPVFRQARWARGDSVIDVNSKSLNKYHLFLILFSLLTKSQDTILGAWNESPREGGAKPK